MVNHGRPLVNYYRELLEYTGRKNKKASKVKYDRNQVGGGGGGGGGGECQRIKTPINPLYEALRTQHLSVAYTTFKRYVHDI